jgi:hypothetical protein
LCGDCGHLQLQNLENSFIVSLYEGDYMNMDSTAINSMRANYLKSKNPLENCAILDVGGGTNSSHRFFESSNYAILDPQVPPDDRVDHIKGFISTANLTEKLFDYIFAFHIFEHLENPREDLRKLSASLKDEGRIFVEVPESKYYARHIPYYLFFHQHINLFTAETLDILFALEGFHKLESSLVDGRLLVTYEKSHHDLGKIEDRATSLTNPIIGIDKLFFIAKEKEVLQDLEKLGPGKLIFLGAGGSTTLLLYHFPELSMKIDSFMDTDNRKIGLNFPGTMKKIERMTSDPEVGAIYLTLGDAIFANWRNDKPDKFIDLKSYFDGGEVTSLKKT